MLNPLAIASICQEIPLRLSFFSISPKIKHETHETLKLILAPFPIEPFFHILEIRAFGGSNSTLVALFKVEA